MSKSVLSVGHLGHVLPVPGQPDRVADPARAALGRPLAHHGGEQRRLAGAVGADQPHHLATADDRRWRAEQRSAFDLQLQLVEHQDLVAAPGVGLEPERHHLFLAGRRREPRQAREPPPPSLGLGALLPGDVAPDEVLLARHHLRLLVVGPELRQPPLGPLPHEGGVATGVGGGALGLEVEHMVHHRLEEGAVVADQEDGLVDLPEIALEPASGLEVEVVGRLVEHQDVGRGRQLAGQPQPAPLAAAQGRELLGPGLRGSKPRPWSTASIREAYS